jgi:hypothetical protein
MQQPSNWVKRPMADQPVAREGGSALQRATGKAISGVSGRRLYRAKQERWPELVRTYRFDIAAACSKAVVGWRTAFDGGQSSMTPFLTYDYSRVVNVEGAVLRVTKGWPRRKTCYRGTFDGQATKGAAGEPGGVSRVRKRSAGVDAVTKRGYRAGNPRRKRTEQTARQSKASCRH